MGLDVYLKDPGQVPGIGPEKGRKLLDGIAKFVSPYGSFRYVAYVGGQAVSALQVVSKDKKTAVIANVFTVTEFRKQGWAAQLLQKARRDFKVVGHAKDDHVSEDGKAWRDKVHAAMTKPTERVAARFIRTAGYLAVNDLVWMGKYKNTLGILTAFGEDEHGNPTITVEPVPKGRKQQKTFSLFKVWKVKPEQIADLKAKGKLASQTACCGGCSDECECCNDD
jgi:predicted GNAT family acetyltransferase